MVAKCVHSKQLGQAYNVKCHGTKIPAWVILSRAHIESVTQGWILGMEQCVREKLLVTLILVNSRTNLLVM